MVCARETDPLALLAHPSVPDGGATLVPHLYAADGTLRDAETSSTWDRRSGAATAGALQGKKLEPHVGIVSYTRSWQTFHPESVEVSASK